VIETVAQLCLTVLAASAAAALYRIVFGPSVADRVAATDLLTTCVMAIALVAGIAQSSRHHIDLVVALGLLGFFGTVALAKYLRGGRPID
jgi:multisubunit Na+/H+ antiporter MnhF subunit